MEFKDLEQKGRRKNKNRKRDPGSGGQNAFVGLSFFSIINSFIRIKPATLLLK